MRALVPVVALYIGKLIIDDVVHLVQMPGRPATFEDWLATGLLNWLGVLILAELALAVLSDILGRVVELVDSLLSERVTNASSVRLMEHAATLDLEDFEDAEFQDQLERARRQTSGRLTLMSQLMGQAQDIVTVASFAAGLLVFAPWLIVLLLVALVPVFLGEAHFNAQTYRLDFGRTPERRELDYVRQTAASVETAKEVKIFGLNRFLIEHYTSLANSFYAANRALALRRATWGGLFTTIGTLGYYIAYAYIVWRTLVGAFSIGDLTFLAGSFLRLRSLLEGLLLGFSSTAGQALYLNDLFSFFEMRPEILSPEHPLPFPRPIREGFVFEDVGFRYPGAERWAVRHLDFTLKAGEVVALVGENGAGKTTLVKLLTRLYDPDEGRILLDGRDLRDYDLDQLRGSMGVIFQDFVRYNFTAGDNIAVGRIAARGDQARIARAARSSQADEVIAGLPGGYDQRIGKRFKNGVELSRRRMAEGGDRARLHARGRGADPRRADGGARCARRVRGVPALQGAQQGQDGRADLASLLERAHGRPHLRAGRRQGRSRRHARGAAGPAGSLRRALRAAGRRLSMSRVPPPGTPFKRYNFRY